MALEPTRYDPKVADEYARHLSAVNRTNQVLATDDILNEQGALLIRKGTPISDKLASKVVRHKLVKPLETSVNLQNVLDAGRLHKLFHQLFRRYPDCQALHSHFTLENLLREQCLLYHRYPLLTQKLTVLSMQRRADFEKSLFCAWLSLAIAFRMRLGPELQHVAFVGGLMHDIGMLHIPTEILDKKGELSAAEWRSIQSHPLIGSLFLKEVPDLNPEVIRAVQEHHERCDGTGYPAGRFTEQLSVAGQIIALVDSIFAIRIYRFGNTGRQLKDLLPILQLNHGLYREDCYRATATLIRELPLERTRVEPDEQMPIFIDRLLQIHRVLSTWFETIPSVVSLLPEEDKNRRIRSAAHLVRNTWFAVASSGLLSPSLEQWMKRVLEDRQHSYYGTMEEIGVMQKEVHWQLKQLKKAFYTLCEDESAHSDEARSLLQKTLTRMEKLDELLR